MSTKPLILALDVSGTPNRWITREDAAFYYAKDLVAWTLGGDDHPMLGGTSRMTGLQSSLPLNTIIAVRGQGNSTKHLYRTPPLTNQALFRRDHHVCAYCGNEFPVSKLTRDHVDPRGRGGKDVWTNVVTACGRCNRVKDCNTPEQAGMQLLYVPYAPNRSEWLILANRRILADQMDYLIKMVPEHSRVHKLLN